MGDLRFCFLCDSSESCEPIDVLSHIKAYSADDCLFLHINVNHFNWRHPESSFIVCNRISKCKA
ncbi:hypothetical protein TcasGA2_TC034221 [Tribolium castaneum]|uniref:Uncharacterized protein n=1 Tax=Tribolium castaneum TaxID=7070 RepID=A0A139WP34_TRICA|nr:hypothetical protein TcasGA2_TC034221 [Tribolium castaneum]